MWVAGASQPSGRGACSSFILPGGNSSWNSLRRLTLGGWRRHLKFYFWFYYVLLVFWCTLNSAVFWFYSKVREEYAAVRSRAEAAGNAHVGCLCNWCNVMNIDALQTLKHRFSNGLQSFTGTAGGWQWSNIGTKMNRWRLGKTGRHQTCFQRPLALPFCSGLCPGALAEIRSHIAYPIWKWVRRLHHHWHGASMGFLNSPEVCQCFIAVFQALRSSLFGHSDLASRVIHQGSTSDPPGHGHQSCQVPRGKIGLQLRWPSWPWNVTMCGSVSVFLITVIGMTFVHFLPETVSWSCRQRGCAFPILPVVMVFDGICMYFYHVISYRASVIICYYLFVFCGTFNRWRPTPLKESNLV